MLQKIAQVAISFYQNYLRIWLGPACRFSPSCSEYARQAVLKYGFWKGARKALGRLLRCHPLSQKIGHDPLV